MAIMNSRHQIINAWAPDELIEHFINKDYLTTKLTTKANVRNSQEY